MPAGALVAPDGRVLWSREATDTRAIGSITKLMTAVVVLDRLALDDTLTVPQQLRPSWGSQGPGYARERSSRSARPSKPHS